MLSRRLNIVIFDEEMALAASLGRDLERLGHDVLCLPLQTSAFSLPEARTWDVGILGIPRLTGRGMDFHRRLRTQRRLRDLPLIVVSDDSDLGYELLDVFDFQVRPIDQARLHTALQELARRQGDPHPLTFDHLQLDDLKAYLIEHTGLHFSQRNQRLLERGLQRRMQTLHIPSATAYLAYLKEDRNQDELNKLLRFLTVGETCFFRYRSHRDAFLHHVLPHLLRQQRQERSLRIWSAGCSTGEEPYSLAILILEHFPELVDWDVRIIATDLNKRALRQAREGIYGSRALRLMDPSLQQRYFEQSGPHFKLRPLVRGMVRFDYLNLQTDSFPDPANQTANLDLLLCRNVLIYFRLDTIRRMVEKFADCLKPSGYLFLGHAETMQNVSDRFLRRHEHGAFFYQLKTKPSAAPTAGRAVATSPSRDRASPLPVPAPARQRLLQTARRARGERVEPTSPPDTARPSRLAELYAQAVSAFDHERFGSAEELFDQILDQHPEHSPSLVGKGLICANRGEYTAARQFCARAIARDDLFPPAYLLRGLILDMEGHLQRALVEYQKVLWLDNHFVMAHYLTAKIYARQHQRDAAIRALRNTIRALERCPDQTMIPFSGGLTRSVFLELARAEFDQATSEE